MVRTTPKVNKQQETLIPMANCSDCGKIDSMGADDFQVNLWTAIKNNDVVLVRELAQQGTFSCSTNNDILEKMVLHAVSDCDPEILSILITSGFNMNVRDKMGRSPLHIVADNNDLQKLETLLQSNQLHTNDLDRRMRNVFHCLLDGNLIQDCDKLIRGVGLLLDNDVDLNGKNIFDETPLLLIFEQVSEFIPRVATFILNKAPDIQLDCADKQGNTFLHYLVSEFVEREEDNPDFSKLVDERESFLCAFLSGEIVGPSKKYIKRLLNIKNRNGFTPLHDYVDCKHYRIETVEQMIAAGADVNSSNNLGTTALTNAALRRRDDIVEVLLRAGASVNFVDCFGQTPLFSVRTTRSFELFRDHGARLDVRDKCGRQALFLPDLYSAEDLPDPGDFLQLSAETSRYRPLAETLIKHGVSVNCVDMYGSTPLHYAAWQDYLLAMKLLLEHGADPGITDSNGYTPQDLALRVGNFEFAQKLGQPEKLINYKACLDFERLKEIQVSEEDVDSINIGMTAKRIQIEPNELVEQMLQSKAHGMVDRKPEAVFVTGTINELITKLGERLGQIDSRFKNFIVPTGSAAEKTNVGDPCEFDFVFCLDVFAQNIEIVQPSDFLESGFALLKPANAFEENLFSFLDSSGHVQCSRVRDTFQDLVLQIINTADFWSFPNLFCDGLVRTEGHKPVLYLQVDFVGPVYKNLTASIDLVPAVYIPSWSPEETLQPFQNDGDKNNPGYLALFHPPEQRKESNYVRISCAPTEINFMRNAPTVLRESYCAAKLLKRFCPSILFESLSDVSTGSDSSTDGEERNETACEENQSSESKNTDLRDNMDRSESSAALELSNILPSNFESNTQFEYTDKTKAPDRWSPVLGWTAVLDNNRQVKKVFLLKQGRQDIKFDGSSNIQGTDNQSSDLVKAVETECSPSSVTLSQNTLPLRNNDDKKREDNSGVRNYGQEENKLGEINRGETILGNRNSDHKDKTDGEECESDEADIDLSQGHVTGYAVKIQICESRNETEKERCPSELDLNDECYRDPEAQIASKDSANEGLENEAGLVWEGGDVFHASEVITSYMLKNCLLYVMDDLNKSYSDVTNFSVLELVRKIFQQLKKRAADQCLPVFYLPYQNFFTYVNAEIRHMDSGKLEEETLVKCLRIERFCDLILNILSYSPEDVPEVSRDPGIPSLFPGS